MELLQRTAKDTGREGVSPVGYSGLPAGHADGREALNHISRRSAFTALILDLPGGSFAFIMATGIVSLAAIPLGHDNVAAAFFALNLFAFPLLCLLMFVRLIQHPLRVLGELRDHRTVASFLTVVAATSILGDQFVLLASNPQVAAALWFGSLALWIALVYAFFVAMTLRPMKPPLALGLDGTWLLTVVATQAIAILATHISGVFSRPDIVVFVALCFFLLGGVFYLIVISLIVQRWLFEPMQPAQLRPSYWINMGAAAITTLAAERLLSVVGANPLTAVLDQSIEAMTVLFWAIATWWVPLLVTLLVWRHIVHGIRLSFGLEYWSMVFPLGMYTAATSALSRQDGAQFLAVIPHLCFWIALTSWLLGFVGMIRHLWRPRGGGPRNWRHADTKTSL
jgi:tellurite resistance protein TehA-like permease